MLLEDPEITILFSETLDNCTTEKSDAGGGIDLFASGAYPQNLGIDFEIPYPTLKEINSLTFINFLRNMNFDTF